MIWLLNGKEMHVVVHVFSSSTRELKEKNNSEFQVIWGCLVKPSTQKITKSNPNNQIEINTPT